MSHIDLTGHIKLIIMSTYNNEPKQTLWEAWFVTSVVLFLGTMFVGTCSGSVQLFPNYDMWLGVTVANLVMCVIIGTQKK